ncbi:hypothetical protein ACLB2K_022788 [Fragaria x ananassa]
MSSMKRQVRAYHAEAKWFHNNDTPTMDEYMEVALVTSAYSMLATTSFVGMGDIVTKDSFEWIFSDPKMVKASEVVCRLMDDIVSHKFEQKKGHVASAVECYMTQYGATEEETIIEFRKQVSDAWKDINEECLHPTSLDMPLLMRIVNLTRVIDVVYKSEDGYTHAETILKDFVASLLEKEATSGRRWRRWKASSETRREKIQKRQKKGIKDSGSTQGNKHIELKKKKKKKKIRGEKPYPTQFFTRRRSSPENEEHSEAALNLISIELGCMCDIWTGFCRVEEEKEFGGGLAVWSGRNLAECGGEDDCGGEREEQERETG